MSKFGNSHRTHQQLSAFGMNIESTKERSGCVLADELHQIILAARMVRKLADTANKAIDFDEVLRGGSHEELIIRNDGKL